MKRILVSNDDGYSAKGIEALANALKPHVQVSVIAPEVNHSGASNSLTLTRPMFLRQASNGFYHVNGTPSDCVHLALTSLLDYRPDLVVSGINNGANLGEDTLYSGTVAAATEGYLFGIPSIAFSLTEKDWPNLEAAAKLASQIVLNLLENPLKDPVLLNINFPPKEQYSLSDVRVTRLGRRHPSRPAEKVYHPAGEPMYWIGPCGDVRDASEDTDFGAIQAGYVSMTPLQIDLTHHQKMGELHTWLTEAHE